MDVSLLLFIKKRETNSNRHGVQAEEISFAPIPYFDPSHRPPIIPEELFLIGRKLCRPDEYPLQTLLDQARKYGQEHNLDWWTVLSMLNKISGKRIAD